MKWHYFLILIYSLAFEVQAQEFPVPDKTSHRIVPKDSEVGVASAYRKLYEADLQRSQEIDQENSRLKSEAEHIRKIATFGEEKAAVNTAPLPLNKDEIPVKAEVKRRPAPTQVLPSGVQTFAVSADTEAFGEVLPAGSWVRAKLLTGVEANSQYPYEVTLQLDYAFTGPNSIKVDMQGCLIIAEAMADLSIERVIIRPRKLSCVRQEGEYIERKVAGFVAGKDSAGGLEGVYSSKQGQVFLAALLASVAKGVGEAVQLSQFEETVSGDDRAQVARNFKGNIGTFAAAKGATEAASMVTDWYLDRAKALLPTIKAGSGQDVWVILTDSVLVPSLFDN